MPSKSLHEYYLHNEAYLTTLPALAAHAPPLLSSFLPLLIIILRAEKSIFHIYPHSFTGLGALQVYTYITSPRLLFTMLGAPLSSIFFPFAWRTSLHVSVVQSTGSRFSKLLFIELIYFTFNSGRCCHCI